MDVHCIHTSQSVGTFPTPQQVHETPRYPTISVCEQLLFLCPIHTTQVGYSTYRTCPLEQHDAITAFGTGHPVSVFGSAIVSECQTPHLSLSGRGGNTHGKCSPTSPGEQTLSTWTAKLTTVYRFTPVYEFTISLFN